MSIQINRGSSPEPVDIDLMIAIPSNDNWEAEFGMDLAALMFYIAQVPLGPNVRKQKVSIINRRTSMLSQSRETLLEEAIARGCTHMLWLDSDMKFPKETAHMLYRHNRVFVGANYVRKSIPAAPVTAAIGGGFTYTDPDSTGLEEVLHIGFGVCLLRLNEDVKSMEAPIFPMPWNEELRQYSGEDVQFSEKLREKGIPTYVDHDLSQLVYHVGRYAFHHDVVGEVQEFIDAEVDAEEQRQIAIEDHKNA